MLPTRALLRAPVRRASHREYPRVGVHSCCLSSPTHTQSLRSQAALRAQFMSLFVAPTPAPYGSLAPPALPSSFSVWVEAKLQKYEPGVSAAVVWLMRRVYHSLHLCTVRVPLLSLRCGGTLPRCPSWPVLSALITLIPSRLQTSPRYSRTGLPMRPVQAVSLSVTTPP